MGALLPTGSPQIFEGETKAGSSTVEQAPYKRLVVGSSPTRPTFLTNYLPRPTVVRQYAGFPALRGAESCK